jgi:rhodanese-related sulfurtransferase
MDGQSSISPQALYVAIGTAAAPIVFDVRRTAAFDADDRMVVSAQRRVPEDVGRWWRDLPQGRPIVVYCVRGHQVSQRTAAALRGAGRDVRYLEGGITGWAEFGLPLRKKVSIASSSWVTRERPKIDRLACPWLVRRFIDPRASFFYTPAHQVRAESQALRAEPYDIADVTFSHRGKRCSFDAFLDEFDLHDPVIDQLADIVRAADTGELGQSREAPGLLAISLGLSANVRDDIVLLEQAMSVYDALYAWCKTARNETHSWPQKVATQ